MIAEEVAESPDRAGGGFEPAQVPHDLVKNPHVVGATAEVPMAEETVQRVSDSEGDDDDNERHAVGTGHPDEMLNRLRALRGKKHRGAGGGGSAVADAIRDADRPETAPGEEDSRNR